MGELSYFTNLNSSADYWVDFPNPNHDSRLRENSEVAT